VIKWEAPRGDYKPISNWFVRAEGGVYGDKVQVIIARETYQGLIIYKTIACESIEQAKAIAGATSMYGVAHPY
jgi:hypothetical protein